MVVSASLKKLPLNDAMSMISYVPSMGLPTGKRLPKWEKQVFTHGPLCLPVSRCWRCYYGAVGPSTQRSGRRQEGVLPTSFFILGGCVAVRSHHEHDMKSNKVCTHLTRKVKPLSA